MSVSSLWGNERHLVCGKLPAIRIPSPSGGKGDARPLERVVIADQIWERKSLFICWREYRIFFKMRVQKWELKETFTDFSLSYCIWTVWGMQLEVRFPRVSPCQVEQDGRGGRGSEPLVSL